MASLGKALLVGFALTLPSWVPGIGWAQQVPDLEYRPVLARPAYPAGTGPRVVVDEAHHNFHTVGGRYRPFAELLRRDGYRVGGLGEGLSADSLKAVDVLVIANALHERNREDWLPPHPSAFTPNEVAAVHAWVSRGGSLLLIVDHMPFPAAARDLAGAFGLEFSNGYARAGHWKAGQPETFELGTGLREGAVTAGRAGDEKVARFATFSGSALKLPAGGIPVLAFGAGSVSVEQATGPGTPPGEREVPIAGWCQGGVFKVGVGRVAVFGEAASLSAQRAGPMAEPMGMNAPEGAQNHQLVLNVLHWLTRVEGMPD